MSVDWGDYQSYEPITDGPLGRLSRKAARAAFKDLMAHKADRIEVLARLVARNGVELGPSDEAVQALNDWFRREVEAHPDRPGPIKAIWVRDLIGYWALPR